MTSQQASGRVVSAGAPARTVTFDTPADPRRAWMSARRSGLRSVADAVVEAAIEIDVDIRAPDCRVQFLARHERPGIGHEAGEHAGRLTLQRNGNAVAPELACRQVDFVGVESSASMKHWTQPCAAGS
jgi:hypothetical protein